MLKQIGKYTISEKLGRGALSRIYRAMDPHGRHVAIKLSTTQPHPAQFDLFQKDLVAASSVLQENLIKVYDLGSEDGFPYLVVEFVAGRDLARVIKAGARLSLATKVRTMLQVAGALRAAHERGISHLDLRPSKIMLGEQGDVKLLGLGQTRLSYDSSLDTENGYLIGQPFYMAPERFNAIELADEPCDIWSFGVTFYELVAGAHPFEDEDGERMVDNIMNSDHADIPNVPDSLNRVLRRTLEKDRTSRYATFGSIIEDLRGVVAELEREESDTLMAQALQQTDSGRWSEARRLARKIQESSPEQAPASSLFGLSQTEPDRMRSAERQTQSAAAVATSPAAVAAIDEEPADEDILIASPAIAVAQANEPAHKGIAAKESAPAISRPGSTNGVKTAASAGVAAAAAARTAVAGRPSMVQTATPPAPAPAEQQRRTVPAGARIASEGTRPQATSAAQRTRPASDLPLPAGRILRVDEPSSGLPWAKILTGIAALAVLGAVYFFLLKPSKPGENMDDAKAARVIQGDKDADSDGESSHRDSSGPMDVTPSATVESKPAQTPTAVAAAADTSDTNPQAKQFNPAALQPVKNQPIKSKKGSVQQAVARLAPPSTGTSSLQADYPSVPLAVVSAPPPPSPVVQPKAPPQTAPQQPTPAEKSQTTPPPASSPRTGGSFTEPVLLVRVKPVYPPAALQHKAQGTVRFVATITKEGDVKDLQLVSGDPYLNLAARNAVMKFKYRPATLNGEPIEVNQSIVVQFTLN